MNSIHRFISLAVFLLWISSQPLSSQELFPENGPRNAVHNPICFKGANIVLSPGEVLTNAMLIIRDERIVSVGKDLQVPKNAVVYDVKGKWIYPSFIDLDSDYGMGPKPNAERGTPGQPQMESKIPGPYSWNEAIKADQRAATSFHHNVSKAEALRKMGIGVVLTHTRDGIIRGTSSLVLTGEERDNLLILRQDAALQMSFSKGSSKQDYPTSLMGTIALIRQTYYDAIWYETAEEKELIDLGLEAIIRHKELPVICEVPDYLSVMRADKIGDEFQKQFIVRGAGDEYKRLEEIKNTGASLIIPAKLPLPYKIENTYDAFDLSYEKLRHWELAPFNPRYLAASDIPFTLTSEGLKPEDFWKNLQKFLDAGLSQESLLEALTTTPAKMIGAENEIGKIKAGFVANFLICSGKVFDKDVVIYENWVNGKRYILNEQKIDIRGEYNLNIGKEGVRSLTVEGSLSKLKAILTTGGKEIPVEVNHVGRQISLKFQWEEGGQKSYILLSGNINDDESRIWAGKAQLPGDGWTDWAAIRQKGFTLKDTSKKIFDSTTLPVLIYPPLAFGIEHLPSKQTVLFKHATVWTSEDTGIVRDADVCIADGKILAIGQGLTKVGLFGTKEIDLKVVDVTGKHITAGIIDEHSHIAISRGVNEGGQAISSEVRIGDVIDPDDINIYRQLSGGVTTSQLLHGSANPIGGQSALIKLRWGYGAEKMKVEDADPFIKFALGENVKQSNWGDLKKVRYPQTRMGVEQTLFDAFVRAREYSDIWKIYTEGQKSKKNKKTPSVAPHRDLELDALVEILNDERFITCHSYVQSEITMLLRVADSMNFRVNTFTHILEGYKVADKMKAHGAGGSTFSDWWAYKFEVNDAIPYNAAIMHSQGITTAINSDDAEMGRRLNQEAAKTIKYGGVSEEEALKMVTINPAKLLHLDHRTGSIKKGKDADLVVWSDHPLSVNAKVEQTYVDGICFFDKKKDEDMRKTLIAEKHRIIQKMLSESGESKKQKITRDQQKLYHCDTMEEEGSDE